VGNLERKIEQVRSFNRFHTLLVGALNEGMLNSEFPLAQARIIFELAHSNDVAAADLVETLSLDRGYLSRMIAALYQQGLVNKAADGKNKKRIVLTLSAKGAAVFASLNQASVNEIGLLIAQLSGDQQDELVSAMENIRRLLGDSPVPHNYTLGPPKPGDMSWIAHRNAKLYTEEYQWDWTFEAMVCSIVSDFVSNFNPQFERCWVAEMNDKVVGSVFVVRHDASTAKLRMLFVEKEARGLGLGGELVEQCINFARQKGYKKLILSTHSILAAALQLYAAKGFELIAEQAHHSFGHDLIAQTWSLDL